MWSIVYPLILILISLIMDFMFILDDNNNLNCILIVFYKHMMSYYLFITSQTAIKAAVPN